MSKDFLKRDFMEDSIYLKIKQDFIQDSIKPFISYQFHSAMFFIVALIFGLLFKYTCSGDSVFIKYSYILFEYSKYNVIYSTVLLSIIYLKSKKRRVNSPDEITLGKELENLFDKFPNKYDEHITLVNNYITSNKSVDKEFAALFINKLHLEKTIKKRTILSYLDVINYIGAGYYIVVGFMFLYYPRLVDSIGLLIKNMQGGK